ncbi:hypothetical protein [Glutamicibacter sp. BW77]|uniref:hypothetical protein n=1 Tax=Glutamicibacter TaxID=1742989 RepID=UPI00197A74D6|nr:hypothetical protein [Glutamicibacter sp. BW77]
MKSRSPSNLTNQFSQPIFPIPQGLLAVERTRHDLLVSPTKQRCIADFEPSSMLSPAVVFAFTGTRAVITFSCLASRIALLSRAVMHINENKSIANSYCFSNIR